MEVSMEYLLEQVMHKDLGKRLQVGQDIAELILDEEKSPDLEQDQGLLDRMVDAVASSWVNSSNFKVSLIRLMGRLEKWRAADVIACLHFHIKVIVYL